MIVDIPTAQKMKFPLRISSVNVDLVTFTEEILNGKLHFLCSVPRMFVELILDQHY